jgi:hypothetical protein
MLPSGCQIVQPANSNIALCILQGLMWTRAHILPTGRLPNLERLLWEFHPPTPGPFSQQLQVMGREHAPKEHEGASCHYFELPWDL